MIHWLPLALLFGFSASTQGTAAGDKPRVEKVDASRCHVFIDFENIWTLEMVDDDKRRPIPILNIITFSEDEEEHTLRPEGIHIYNQRGQRAKVEKLSIDTGVEGDPYVAPVLEILQSSFIGMDLVGEFGGFDPPARVSIELGDSEFQLQAVDCMDYNMLAERIENVNFNSPNIKEDYEVLKIEPIGKKVPRRKGRK